jgi:hypothetical protein
MAARPVLGDDASAGRLKLGDPDGLQDEGAALPILSNAGTTLAARQQLAGSVTALLHINPNPNAGGGGGTPGSPTKGIKPR